MARVVDIKQAHAEGLLRGSACSFGVFDGVHRGHQMIIDRAAAAAREAKARCVILTFDIDPDELFKADTLRKLMTNSDRIACLSALDVDAVVVLPFTLEFAAQEPLDFLEATFGSDVPSSLHVGVDFRFGVRASGRIEDISSWGSAREMRVHGHDLLLEGDLAVSSSRIRRLLSEGKVEEAASLLGRPYSLTSAVQAGRGEGRDFGFRTANLHVPESLRCLSDGVYAAYALVDGRRYKAAVSSGVAPTFADEARANMEVHILDFEGDLYGSDITVEFMYWLRPMMTFPNLDELIATVTGNINWVRENL